MSNDITVAISNTNTNTNTNTDSNELNELATELAEEYKSVSVNNTIIKSKYKPYHYYYNMLYKEYSLEKCRLISRKERELNNYISSSLTYGEIDYHDFKYIFEKLYDYDFPLTGGTFVDIGCGSGRPV